MSTNSNDKELVARWYEAHSTGNTAALDDLFSPDYINHEPTAPNGGWPRGPEGPKMIVTAYRASFPDLNFTIETQFADGDKVVTRWNATATHAGPLMGIPATGKSARITGTSIERIANDKIAETWINFDMLGLLTQLGLIPSNA